MNAQLIPPLDESIIASVEEHFAYLLSQDKDITKALRKALSTHAPIAEKMIAGLSDEQLYQKLMTALISVIQSLRQPIVLREYFQTLAEQYFIDKPADILFEQLSVSWFSALTSVTDNISSDVVSAWQTTLNYLKATMLDLIRLNVNQPLIISPPPPSVETNEVENVEYKNDIFDALDNMLFQNKLLAFNLTLEVNRPETTDPSLQRLAMELRQSTQQALHLLDRLRDTLK